MINIDVLSFNKWRAFQETLQIIPIQNREVQATWQKAGKRREVCFKKTA